MKKLFYIFVVFLGFQNGVFAQKMESPVLEFVCELKVTTSERLVVGETQHGIRRIIPITGGTFEGPNFKGTVLSGGADYQYANKENTRTEIEAIYELKTDDGVIIHVRNKGLSLRTKEQAEALAKGETIDASKLYFRAIPTFEAPQDSKYNWLNNAVFVCTKLPTQGVVHLAVFKVL